MNNTGANTMFRRAGITLAHPVYAEPAQVPAIAGMRARAGPKTRRRTRAGASPRAQDHLQ